MSGADCSGPAPGGQGSLARVEKAAKMSSRPSPRPAGVHRSPGPERVSTPMIVQPTVQPIAAVEARWLALGVFQDELDPPESVRGTPLGDLVERLLAAKELPGGLGDATPLLGLGGLAADYVLVFGLGKRERFDAGAAFSAGVAAGKWLAGKARESVAAVLPDAGDRLAVASALTEGLIVGSAGPGLRKGEPSRHPFGDPPDRRPPRRRAGARRPPRGDPAGRDRRRGGQPGPRAGQHAPRGEVPDPAGRACRGGRDRRRARR